MQETTKNFIKKLPEAIGLGVGLSLLFIGLPYMVLEILAPNYVIEFNQLFLRWAGLCVFLTVIYYWDKTSKNRQ